MSKIEDLKARLRDIHDRCNAIRAFNAGSDTISASDAQELDELLAEGDSIVAQMRQGHRDTRIDHLSDLLDGAPTPTIPVPITVHPDQASGPGHAINHGVIGSGADNPNSVRILNKGEKLSDPHAANGLTFGGFMRSVIAPHTMDERYRAQMTQGSDGAGGYTVSPALVSQVLDNLRARSVLTAAGATTMLLPAGEVHVAKLTEDIKPRWIHEAQGLTETKPSFGRVTFISRLLTAEIKISRELVEDSQNAEQALMDSISGALAAEVDRVGLIGTGTGGEPRGVLNTPGIGRVSMGVDGAAPTDYSQYLHAGWAVTSRNAPAVTAFCENPRTTRDVGLLVDSTGQPLMKPNLIEQIPVLSTTSIPTTDEQGSSGAVASRIYAGYWPYLIWGVRHALTVEVNRSTYASEYQLQVIATMRGDWQISYPEGFCVIDGVLEA